MATGRPAVETERRPPTADARVEGGQPDLPDAAAHTPRVSSNDWILKYVHEPLRGVSFGRVFDEGGRSELDVVPLPIDTENFVADELFDFLKKIELQGKGLRTLDALAKKIGSDRIVASPKSGPSDAARKPAQHDFDTDPSEPHARLAPSAPDVTPQEEHLISFLRGIEERYKVLRGEQRHCKWERSTADQRRTRFAAKSANPGAADSGATAADDDSCEETSIEASTPLSTSSRSLGERTTPSPLTLPAGGRSGGKGEQGEDKVYCDPSEIDVLLGRGGLTNHHAGNKRYRHEIDQLKPWYSSCQTKTEKKELSALFIEYIHGYGGRFLEREESTGRWYLAPYRRARKKASQALRENKKQRREQAEDGSPSGS